MRFRKSRTLLLGILIGIGISLHTPAVAAIHDVPGEFATITAALAAASPTDTVLVAPGIYSPSSNGETFPLYVTLDSLHVLGAGMEVSIIDAESDSTVFMCNGAVGSRISGFTITGGSAFRGGGIWIRQFTPMEIDHNLIMANAAVAQGAGMLVDGDAWIHHNVVWENFDGDTSDTKDPHSVVTRGALALFEHNLVGRGDGNGLLVSGSNPAEVRHNIFFENGTPPPFAQGRGICWLSETPVNVYHNLFFSNAVAALLIPDLGGDYSAEEANDLFPDDDIYGNLDADPLLVDPDSGDFHLSSGSPAIDAGRPDLPWDPDSTIADLGPFYFHQSAGVLSWYESPTRGALSVLSDPFHPTTTLQFVLFEPGTVSLAVYDIHGRRLAVLAAGHFGAGEFNVTWDRTNEAGNKVGSGVYFVRLHTRDFRTTRKMILVE